MIYDISDNEKAIIDIMREIKPFEIVEIKKDPSGKPDSYIVRREQKIHFIKLGVKLST